MIFKCTGFQLYGRVSFSNNIKAALRPCLLPVEGLGIVGLPVLRLVILGLVVDCEFDAIRCR